MTQEREWTRVDNPDSAVSTGTVTFNPDGKILNYQNDQFGKYRMASIPTEAVDSLVSYIDSLGLEWEEGMVKHTGEVDYKSRKSDVAWIEDPDIQKYIWMQFCSANQDPDWQFNIDSIEPIQYTRYRTSSKPEDSNPLVREGDHYNWHNDQIIHNDGKERRCRKLSMSLQLNDGFEGCSFDFGSIHKGNVKVETINLKKGDILVFKSMMEHRINPILSVERKVLVSWAWGTLFK